MHCGKVLQDILYERRITKAQFARTLGISPQRMSQIARQESMRTDQLERICRYLDMLPSEFVKVMESQDGKADFRKWQEVLADE